MSKVSFHNWNEVERELACVEDSEVCSELLSVKGNAIYCLEFVWPAGHVSCKASKQRTHRGFLHCIRAADELSCRCPEEDKSLQWKTCLSTDLFMAMRLSPYQIFWLSSESSRTKVTCPIQGLRETQTVKIVLTYKIETL